MDLQDINKALAKRTQELEEAKAKELSNVNARLAELQQKEDARKREAQALHKAKVAAALKRRLDEQAAEEQLQREVNEKRVLEEQAYSQKQTTLEAEELTADELEKSLIEQQFIEEQVRKSLDNAKYSVRKSVGNDGEQIMPNPLARFLQKSPE